MVEMFTADGMEIYGTRQNYVEATEFIRQYNGPLGCVMDIGAHQGSLALYAAKRGSEIVIAVEPHPDNFKVMQENVRRNDFRWIVMINMAVDKEDGIGFMTNMKYSPESGEHMVGSMSFQRLLDAYWPIDYLKIDIEEHEYKIFNEDLDLSGVRYIELELHHPYGSEMERVRELLREKGFDLWEGEKSNPARGYNRRFDLNVQVAVHS